MVSLLLYLPASGGLPPTRQGLVRRIRQRSPLISASSRCRLNSAPSPPTLLWRCSIFSPSRPRLLLSHPPSGVGCGAHEQAHHHHHQHHHGHEHTCELELNSVQKAILRFAKAVGWADLADLLREHLQLCSCSMVLLLLSAACPYVLPARAAKLLQNAFISIAFPLIGIREAEKTTVCQAKKIEELELQLGEAEDTIVDLREDLKRVREELLMLKNGSVQPSIHPSSEANINDACMAICNNIRNETSTDNLNEPRNMPILCNNIATLSQKTTGSHQNAEKAEYHEGFSEADCAGNSDLASFIWNKAPEPYRKGYNQRIHALEHNLTSKGPFAESNALRASSKSEPLTCASEKPQIPCKTSQAKNHSMFEEPGCSGKDHLKFFSEFSPRKQRTMYKQSNSSNKFIIHDKCDETEASKETPAPFIQAATEIDETSEDKKSVADISTERESLMLNQCRFDTSMKIVSAGIHQCTERRDCGILRRQNQSVCVDEFMQNSLRSGEDAKDPLLSRTFCNNGGHPSSVAIQEDLEDRIEAAVTAKEEVEDISENLDYFNAVKVDTNDIANGSAQTGTDKFLKYTFQRKRKKGSSPIKNEIVFPEKKPTLKLKSVEKQNSMAVPSKSGVATDLPRNNRRLVQVARQLISLSEKRW